MHILLVSTTIESIQHILSVALSDGSIPINTF